MAAFENKTIGEVKTLITNSIQSKFNQTLRALPKSFLNVIATVFSGVFVTCYKQIGWLFLQLFPDTADFEPVSVLGRRIRPLIKWGDLIGVGSPKTGTQWKGTITVTVNTTGGVLVAGTQLKSDSTGTIYITGESVPLDAATVTVPLEAAAYGTIGNLDPGDTLSFIAPMSNVQKTAAAAGTDTYAVDEETEESYRARVVQRFRSPPLGGALADYRKWGMDVDGVYNIYPYKKIDTAAGVLLYVAASQSLFPDRIPDAALLKKVGDACTYDPVTGAANRKPIGAVIDPAGDGSYQNVLPVTIVRFDVHIDGMTGAPLTDFVEMVRPLLDDYFLGREPYIRGLSDDNNRINIVSRNNVLSAADQGAISVKAEFESVTMYRDGEVCAVYTLGQGELAALDHLLINGTEASR